MTYTISCIAKGISAARVYKRISFLRLQIKHVSIMRKSAIEPAIMEATLRVAAPAPIAMSSMLLFIALLPASISASTIEFRDNSNTGTAITPAMILPHVDIYRVMKNI